MEFEKSLQEIEQITEQMAGGKLDLKKTLEAFKKGMGLIKKCRKELEAAEQTVEKLIKIDERGVQTEKFESLEEQEED